MSEQEKVNLKLTYLLNKLTLVSCLSKNIVMYTTLRKAFLMAMLLDLIGSILISKSSVNAVVT